MSLPMRVSYVLRYVVLSAPVEIQLAQSTINEEDPAAMVRFVGGSPRLGVRELQPR